MSTTDLCTLLDWDTAFFKRRIARVHTDSLTADDAQSVDVWCANNSIDCLYFLARADKPSVRRVAQMYGFDLVDMRVTYVRALTDHTPSAKHYPETLVRAAELADLPTLQEIAGHSHTDSRFYADAHFPRHLCDALYSTWIARSYAGGADAIFVAELERSPVGYISCHKDTVDKQGSIGLVGVDKRVRGQGIGNALIGQALDWFGEQHMRTVTVVTQGCNIAAHRLYQRNNFLTQSVQLWYHKWYEPER